MAYLHFRHLIEKGLIPFKDESYLTNGHLDTVIDWIPGMKGIRLRDIPSFIRTTDPENFMLNFLISETERAQKASAIVLNTFDALEHEVLAALSSLPKLPYVYSIGSLQLLLNKVKDSGLKSIGSNLWKEESGCLDWLDSKEPNSVIYINFGSAIVTKREKLVEIAWGLANSNKNFLWVVRPNLVSGANAVLRRSL
ncbi:hypothetical protein GH714_033485 [Hevea brasiliensis]|uniref:Anthocyanidin 3-O-glucosyltransferase n=1 Tax=Hevea brasiliensis TaxID=3981 RepID=A0A6A6MQC5_HEVBR|nr:hypothetical protein GH714_033485 [Hevea brasiliensis]